MVSVPMSLRFCRIILDNSLNVDKCIRIQSQYQFHKRFWNTTTAGLSTEATNEKEKTEGEEIENDAAAEPKIQIEQLSKQIETLTKEKSEFEDKYKRSLADGENLRKRLTKQIEDAKLFGIQSFCKDLLEVADILGKATECVPKEEVSDSNPHLKNLYEGLTLTEAELKKVSGTLDDAKEHIPKEDVTNNNVHLKSLYEGIRMTEAVLNKVFTRHNLIPVNPLNEKFNPNLHEALFQQEVEGKEAGIVVVVSKIGYKLHERCIRPALVGVAKGS